MNDHDDLETRLRASLARQAETVTESTRSFDPNWGGKVGFDETGSGLPATLPRRRWAASAAVAAAALVLVVAGVAFAANRDPSGTRSLSVGASPNGPGATVASVTAAQPVTLQSLNGLFVATSAEYNSATFAKAWPSYASWAVQVGTNRCLSDKGSPYRIDVDAATPPWVRSEFWGENNTQFPDLARIETGSFTGPTPSATTAPSSGPTTTVDEFAYNAAVTKCMNQVAEPYKAVSNEVNRYVNRYGSEQAGMDADPEVKTARVEYVTCMAARGITVSEPGSHGVVDGGVFDLADQATRNGDTERVTQLAKAYGTCFEPVSKAMDVYRLAKRAEFYNQYKTQLEQLAIDIDHAETQISNEYGIPRP